MRVCVTGASGFIGQHVAKALCEAGHYVIGLDQILAVPGTCPEWRLVDITYPLEKIPGLDAVIHLAALANPRECDADPAKAFNINVNGTHQVLKIALESGAKKVVFSSSAHVYDIPPKWLPTDETAPLRLNNTYTTTKILGEQLCQLYFENHGLSHTTLRLFNAYGPGQSRGYFIPDMVAKARSGPIHLAGGLTTKDFIHVGDVARAFLLGLETSFVGPINIGTGQETQLFSIATTIANRFEVACDDNGGAATRMCADWHRAERVLGWCPTVSLEEGLRAAIGAAEKVAV